MAEKGKLHFHAILEELVFNPMSTYILQGYKKTAHNL